RRKAMKHMEPPKFKGLGDTKPVIMWLRMMQEYIRKMEVAEEDMVDVVSAFLEGDAAIWWTSMLLKMDRNTEDPILSWADFTEAIICYVGGGDTDTEDARLEWRRLRQTGTVNDFIQRFNVLLTRVVETTPAE